MSAQKEKPGNLGPPQLLVGGKEGPGPLGHFYESKHEHHRGPQAGAQGCQIQKGWRRVWGPAVGCVGWSFNGLPYSALSSLVSVVILRRFSLTLINSGGCSSSFSGGFSS